MPQAAEADLFRRALLVACLCIAVLDAIFGLLLFTVDRAPLEVAPNFERTLSWLPVWAWAVLLVVGAAGLIPQRSRVVAFGLLALWYATWGVGLATETSVKFVLVTYGIITWLHVFIAIVQVELGQVRRAVTLGRSDA